MLKSIIGVLGCALLSSTTLAQLSDIETWAAELETRYTYLPNVTYVTANGVEQKIDIYHRSDVTTPQPTLIFMHGGFWVVGSKDNQLPALLPWLAKGWNVVNVEYRLADVALAPAALVDSFCALRFIGENAAMYNIDVNRIVASGQSAGGHLALSLAMLDGAGFDANCPAGTTPQVAAIINWFGVSDVPDVIAGANKSDAALRWFGDLPEAEALELASTLSPLNFVTNDLPPILTIQGDADPVVPYAQGVALHEALKGTNVINQLLTIPGGQHGRFKAAERVTIYQAIDNFLQEAGLE